MSLYKTATGHPICPSNILPLNYKFHLTPIDAEGSGKKWT